MATNTVDNNKPQVKKAARINRFDSPWLNSRFITGTVMIGLVIVIGLVGPLVWNTQLSLVASSPLNLPPVWVQNPAVENQIVPAATVIATNANTISATATNSGFGSSGLGGSGLTNLMVTQTLEPAATATPNSGFGSSGLGGSGLTNLMVTQTLVPEGQVTVAAAAEATEQIIDLAASRPLPVGAARPEGTSEHPLGTDNSGRDMLAVLIVGAPASLRVGVTAAGVGMLVGIILGFAAGFMGGWVDAVIRTASDVAFTIPSLAVLLVISAYLRRMELDTMALLLALFAWPVPTRLIRAQVLSMRERGYIRMAQLSGQSTFSIMFREMLPNLLPYLAASLAGNISGAILAATSLEALGLGPTRYPTLGMTIFYSIRGTAILRGMWWWWGFPILVLMFMFTGLFMIATGLDEIANPRLRGAQGK